MKKELELLQEQNTTIKEAVDCSVNITVAYSLKG
jgi:hypothetical protein